MQTDDDGDNDNDDDIIPKVSLGQDTIMHSPGARTGPSVFPLVPVDDTKIVIHPGLAESEVKSGLIYY